MKLLLDTQLLLWAAVEPKRLPSAAAHLMGDQSNLLIFSAASIWEVAIKAARGRASFQVDPRLLRRGLLDNNYDELAIEGVHAANLDTLPPIHKDPFDRILVSQALVEGITLVTADAIVASYPGPIQLV